MVRLRARKKGSEMREVVLRILLDQPRHIYEIREALEDKYPGRWDRQQLASVLGDMRRLLYLGRIDDKYRVTPVGKEYLKEIVGSS